MVLQSDLTLKNKDGGSSLGPNRYVEPLQSIYFKIREIAENAEGQN